MSFNIYTTRNLHRQTPNRCDNGNETESFNWNLYFGVGGDGGGDRRRKCDDDD